MDAATWDERYEGREFVWTVTVNTFVETHLADLASTIDTVDDDGRRRAPAAIDLAAGEARNAVWLAARGWRVTAVDFSAVGLTKGERLAGKHLDPEGRPTAESIDFVVADATEWQPAEPVDLVVLSYFQLAAPARTDVLRAAAGWVRPGGVVFVVAHDRSNVADGHGGPPSEAVCYDLDETLECLRAGTPAAHRLDPEVAEVARREVTTPDGTAIALDTLVMARVVAD